MNTIEPIDILCIITNGKIIIL